MGAVPSYVSGKAGGFRTLAELKEQQAGSSDVTAVEIPVTVTRLLEPHPNPFNPRVTLRYEVAESGRVDLVIYDVRGRAVRHLAGGDHPRGRFTAIWTGVDDRGRSVASGVYLVRMTTGSQVFRERMTLVR